MSYACTAHINVAALQHNLTQVRRLAPHSNILAMVKANAYGHGIDSIAEALTAADAFGVAVIEEAIQLRAAGVNKPIVLLEGFVEENELDEINHLQCDVVIHHPKQIEILTKKHLQNPISVWLKIDTGMHRLGLKKAIPDIYQQLLNCPNVKQPIILMTHFANADDRDDPKTNFQIQQLFNISQQLAINDTIPLSMANSGGIMGWSDSHCQWVRPGIMLYGISPFKNTTGMDVNLKPVMTLTAKLIAIRHLQKGDTIGYGSTWRCPSAMPVGVLAIGYGDGYPRIIANNTPCLLHDNYCPIVGRVSMDLITIDLRNCPHAEIGDDVIMWGEGLPVECIAEAANTIAYELVCRMSINVNRTYEKCVMPG